MVRQFDRFLSARFSLTFPVISERVPLRNSFSPALGAEASETCFGSPHRRRVRLLAVSAYQERIHLGESQAKLECELRKQRMARVADLGTNDLAGRVRPSKPGPHDAETQQSIDEVPKHDSVLLRRFANKMSQ